MNRIFFLVVVFSTAIVLRAQQKPSTSENSLPQRSEAGFVPPPSVYGTENLHSLSIADSNLHPAAPLSGETDHYPEFSRELLQLQWRDGDPIDLYVIKPRGVTKPPPILYLYSYPSETDRFKDNDYCKRVTSNGYAAIGFVSALTGQRYHDRPMREWFVSEMPEATAKSVHDVQMILRYLSDRGDLDMAHIGIFATGSGATIAILATSVAGQPRIQAVDALQPWGDWPDWLAKSSLVPENERASYLQPKFLADVALVDPMQWFGRVQAVAFRLQFVLDDPVTPAQAVQRMKLAAAGSLAQIVEYSTRHQQYEVLNGGRAFEWVKDQLRPPVVRTTASHASSEEHKSPNESNE